MTRNGDSIVLCAHPNTRRFVAKLIVHRFLSSLVFRDLHSNRTTKLVSPRCYKTLCTNDYLITTRLSLVGFRRHETVVYKWYWHSHSGLLNTLLVQCVYGGRQNRITNRSWWVVSHIFTQVPLQRWRCGITWRVGRKSSGLCSLSLSPSASFDEGMLRQWLVVIYHPWQVVEFFCTKDPPVSSLLAVTTHSIRSITKLCSTWFTGIQPFMFGFVFVFGIPYVHMCLCACVRWDVCMCNDVRWRMLVCHLEQMNK